MRKRKSFGNVKAHAGGSGRVVGRLRVKVVNSQLALENLINHIDGLVPKSLVALDNETTSLDWWRDGDEIVSLNIGTKAGQFCVPIYHPEASWDEPEEVLDRLLGVVANSRLRIIGHNFKFDALWYRKYGHFISCHADTMLMSYITDENQRHALDECVWREFGIRSWDVDLAVKQGKAGRLVEDHAPYACKDVFYTRELYLKYKSRIDHESGTRRMFWELTMPAANMMVNMEWGGVYVDPKRIHDGKMYWEAERAKAMAELTKLAPSENSWKDKKTKTIKYGVNWNSPAQVADILFNRFKLSPLDRTGKGAYSTSESVLKRLAAKHPLPSWLLKFREADKQLSTFIDSWLGKIDFRNRLHPSFKLHGTVTGRLSCEKPNLQQVPRDKRIRSLVTAPPGWVMVEADYSQVELRIAAELSRDPELLLAYQTGQDVHTITVQRIFGIQKPTPEERKKGKAINFGFIYGMGAAKFQQYALDNYETIFDEAESKRIRKGFFKLYHGLPDWHVKQRRFAHGAGYVRSLIGRKRRLPMLFEASMAYDDLTPEQREAQRQAVNSPVQSLASDMNLTAAVELSSMFSRSYFQIVGLIHDATLFYVRREKLKEVLPVIKRVMERPKKFDEWDLHLSIPIIVDVKVGDAWGSGTEIKDIDQYISTL